jgi:hypothetical protein
LNKDHPRRRVRQRQHHRYQGEPQEVRGRGSSRQKAKLNIEALQATAQPGGINEYIDLGAPGASLNWDALYGSSPDDRVVFVHANGSDLQLDFSANREARSTLVVHCGNPTIGARNSRGSSQFWTIRAVPISAGGDPSTGAREPTSGATSTPRVPRRTPQHTWTERRG